jgi:hypothetical protein
VPIPRDELRRDSGPLSGIPNVLALLGERWQLQAACKDEPNPDTFFNECSPWQQHTPQMLVSPSLLLPLLVCEGMPCSPHMPPLRTRSSGLQHQRQMLSVQGPWRRPLISRSCFAAPTTRVESSARCASTRSSFTATTRFAVSLLRVRLRRIHTGRRRVEARDASGAVTTRAGRALIAGLRALAMLNGRRRSLDGPRCWFRAKAPERERSIHMSAAPPGTDDVGWFHPQSEGALLRRSR